MRNIRFTFLPALLFILMMNACNQQEKFHQWQITSPDGTIKVNVSQDSTDGWQYDVLLSDQKILEKSPLGIVTSEDDFKALTFVSVDSSNGTENYELLHGKKLVNKNDFESLTLNLKSALGNSLAIDFRVFNDGVAFRYSFPDAKQFTVTYEKSGFNFPDGKVWTQAYDSVTKYTPAYEKYYEDGIAIGTGSPNPSGWCFPSLFQINDAWALITETGLDKNYFGAHLNNKSGSGLYTIEQPDPSEVFGQGDINGILTGPTNTPWRIIVISHDLAGIVETNLVNDLAAKKVEGDFSWVKPGRASWSWWSDQPSPRDFNTLKKFVDFAFDMKWEYSLVDANWNEMKNGDLQKLAQYAASKNVGLWAWYNSGGSHNEVTEQPRDIMNDPQKRKEEMKKLHDWGIKGIKVDFFQSDKQFIISQYIDILKDAADNELMVNFHGCTIPRGWSRTWPNLLSMESVRGGESYLFASDFPERAPLHNVHLAFTRNVIGPMDYTPVTFSNNTYPHITTFGHELALSIVYETGILHLADAVSSYQKVPKEVKEFLTGVPVVWDQTKFLSGSPSSDVMIARQREGKWYVGYINGHNSEKDVEVDFSFLEEGNYESLMIGDGDKQNDFSIVKSDVANSNRKTVHVKPFGGFVIVIGK